MAGARRPGKGRGPPGGPAPDLAAWAATYSGRLRRYFARRAPPGDADDLVQDVFLRLQLAGGREVSVVDVERYLFAIAHNVLVSQRRSRAVRQWAQHQALEEADEPATDLSPERILVARQDYARFVKAVGELPPRARAAFELHHFEDLGRSAIAERMGISAESVKELLHRAAVRIGQAMEPDS
jgi:RNA polymerase sigma factor (sigma-70 family)